MVVMVVVAFNNTTLITNIIISIAFLAFIPSSCLSSTPSFDNDAVILSSFDDDDVDDIVASPSFDDEDDDVSSSMHGDIVVISRR